MKAGWVFRKSSVIKKGNYPRQFQVEFGNTVLSQGNVQKEEFQMRKKLNASGKYASIIQPIISLLWYWKFSCLYYCFKILIHYMIVKATREKE